MGSGISARLVWSGQGSDYTARGFHGIGSAAVLADAGHALVDHLGLRTEKLAALRIAPYRIVKIAVACVADYVGGPNPTLRSGGGQPRAEVGRRGAVSAR